MAKIHGLVYIVTGFLVSSISWKINYAKMFLFFYIGIVFILIGIVRLVLTLKEDKEETKTQLVQKNLRQNFQIHQQNIQKQHYKRCQRCGTIARIHDNFCSRCGARI